MGQAGNLVTGGTHSAPPTRSALAREFAASIERLPTAGAKFHHHPDLRAGPLRMIPHSATDFHSAFVRAEVMLLPSVVVSSPALYMYIPNVVPPNTRNLSEIARCWLRVRCRNSVLAWSFRTWAWRIRFSWRRVSVRSAACAAVLFASSIRAFASVVITSCRWLPDRHVRYVNNAVATKTTMYTANSLLLLFDAASMALWPDCFIIIAIAAMGIIASILGYFAVRENNRGMKAIN